MIKKGKRKKKKIETEIEIVNSTKILIIKPRGFKPKLGQVQRNATSQTKVHLSFYINIFSRRCKNNIFVPGKV